MNGDNGGKVGAIGELRRDIAPARDLWPGIAAAIGAKADAAPAGTAGPGTSPGARHWRSWRAAVSPAWALAAAVACLAVGVWVGRASLPGTPPLAAATGPGAVDGAVQTVSYAPDARFERTRERLLREVSLRLAQLSPETRARVEASLATVQRARVEIGEALGRDPGNALLQEMLVNSYQDEMRVLTTVREIGT